MNSLEQGIRELTSKVDGRFGCCVLDVQSGAQVGVLIDDPLPMASTCKVPILVDLFRQVDAGIADISERVTFQNNDQCFGSGLLNAFTPGLQPTLHDLALMMIVVSDNAATDLLLARRSPEQVTQSMRALGLEGIKLDRTIAQLLGDYFTALDPSLVGMKVGEWDDRCAAIPGLEDRSKDLDTVREAVNTTCRGKDRATPLDLARLMAQMARGECASGSSCEAMLEILDYQQLNTRLPKDLPPFTRFPHKTGTLGSGAVVNDVGLLYVEKEPVAAIACLSENVRNPISETSAIMGQIGRLVFDYFAG